MNHLIMKKSIFFKVLQPSDSLFRLVEEAFDNRISAIYNYQCSTLKKLQNLEDRYCEIMFLDHTPVGFLIYKKILQQEFGLKNAFELKTLFVFDPEKNVRKGLGSLLFDRAAALAQEKKASCTYSTVAESNVAMIACAAKNGFRAELYGKILTKGQRKYYPLEENEVLIIKYR
jgi:RimJ/RimL family protein N-acetyltransferase